MRKIDIIIQSIMIWPMLLFYTLSTMQPSGHEWLFIIMCIQLILGPWQLISALVKIIVNWSSRNSAGYQLLLAYAILVVTYFSTLVFLNNLNDVGLIIIYAVVPTIIGLYYYVITIKFTNDSAPKKLSGFLPHISF